MEIAGNTQKKVQGQRRDLRCNLQICEYLVCVAKKTVSVMAITLFSGDSPLPNSKKKINRDIVNCSPTLKDGPAQSHLT